jgi:hypothetical protein
VFFLIVKKKVEIYSFIFKFMSLFGVFFINDFKIIFDRLSHNYLEIYEFLFIFQSYCCGLSSQCLNFIDCYCYFISINDIYIWAITEKQGICFLNSGFVFWLLVIFFVELNVQIIRKNKQVSI